MPLCAPCKPNSRPACCVWLHLHASIQVGGISRVTQTQTGSSTYMCTNPLFALSHAHTYANFFYRQAGVEPRSFTGHVFWVLHLQTPGETLLVLKQPVAACIGATPGPPFPRVHANFWPCWGAPACGAPLAAVGLSGLPLAMGGKRPSH